MKRNHKIISKHSLNTKQLPRRVSYANLRASLIACHYINAFFMTKHESLTKIPDIDDDEIARYHRYKVIKTSSDRGKAIIEAIRNYSTDLSDMKKQGVVIIGYGFGFEKPVHPNFVDYDHAIAVVSSRKNFKYGHIYTLRCDGHPYDASNYYIVENGYSPVRFRSRAANKYDWIPFPQSILYDV